MHKSSLRKAVLLTTVFALTLAGGTQHWLRADAKGEDDTGSKPGVAEARALVKQLEERVWATEADLKKARELLATVEAAAERKSGPNTNDLEGVWRIVSIDGNRPGGKFVKPPYDEYKIMTAGHYLWLSFNPETGAVVRSGGGTYSLKDGVYTAHIDYSNAPDLRAEIGKEYKGTCRIEGKRYYHYGHITNGVGFDELWERVH